MLKTVEGMCQIVNTVHWRFSGRLANLGQGPVAKHQILIMQYKLVVLWSFALQTLH